MFLKLFICLTVLANLTAFAAGADLYAKYKKPGTSFIVNKKLSPGANIFLHESPSIALEAVAKAGPKNLNDGLRKAYEAFAKHFAGSQTPIETVKDGAVESKNGDIPFRMYRNHEPKQDRVIVYVHGGGWARGNLNTHDELCRRLCSNTKSVVIAVDYKLAPEHVYPAGFEDVKAVYDWVLQNRSSFGLDKDAKIIMAGDSAGGNLVVALNLWLIDNGKDLPHKNLLLYPALDLSIPEETDNDYVNGYLLTQDSINKFVIGYVGTLKDAIAKTKNDPYLSPMLASPEQLSKLPNTLIISAECDPLEAQAKTFISKIKAAGNNNIDQHVEPGMIHIYAQFFGVFEGASKSLEKMVEFIG
ncbi:MAG: alpha/beta hydrolase [Proteobacteria bacterium]|nr:alpha/beta hydrolase [Pseudomonadota bacterium]